MKNSIVRARCFFFTGCERWGGRRRKSVGNRGNALKAIPASLLGTYQADLRGNQVAQPVEPVDVGLQVAGFTLTEETLHRGGEERGGGVVSTNQPNKQPESV